MEKNTKQKSVVIALLIATFLTAIEGTIVSTAMPRIVDDLGGSLLYTWVISVYLLAMVISTPIFGKLADLFGRKIMFSIGIIIFLIGSTLSGFSQSMEQLIIYRLIQGIGAGALTTIPFTIIGDIFPFNERAKVQGWMSSVWGIAGIAGPLVGGFIVDNISWHWIFFMNLPFGIVSLILLWVLLKENIEKKKHSIDYAGIFSFAISMTTFLYALTEIKIQKHFSTSIIILFIISIIFLGLFLWIETKAKEPMLPLSLFKHSFITISNIAGFLLGFILVTVSYYIPLWVQGVSNLNATYSGISMLPMSLTWPFGAVLSGRWMTKMSIGKITMIGISIIILSNVGLVFVNSDTTIVFLMIITAIMGFGYGIAFTAFTVAVQSSVDWNIRGAAVGSHNLLKNLGQAIGIAVSGLLLSDQLKGEVLATSLHSVFVLLFILSILAFVTSGILQKKKGNQVSLN